MDFNAHMKNTAYLDLAGDVRMMFFNDHGFPMAEFERLRIGPVVLKDELDYFRELRLLETVTVTLTLAGASENLSRFRLRNEFFTAEKKLAARIISTGGWLDLNARKLTIPPDTLAAAMKQLTRTEDFQTLPSKGV
jgi:acyl-CoA thioester hydrolase